MVARLGSWTPPTGALGGQGSHAVGRGFSVELDAHWPRCPDLDVDESNSARLHRSNSSARSARAPDFPNPAKCVREIHLARQIFRACPPPPLLGTISRTPPPLGSSS